MDPLNLYFILQQCKCILINWINRKLGLGQLVQCFSLVIVSQFITFVYEWVFSIKISEFKSGERAVIQDERKDFRLTQHLFSAERH